MTRRGAILLEVLLSIALFVAAGSLVLGAIRNVARGLDRDERVMQAVDVARTRLGELEAGLVSLEDLRSGSSDRGDAAREPGQPPWVGYRVEVATTRSEFTDCTLVEVSVFDAAGEGGAAAAGGTGERLAVLRQLMRLSRVPRTDPLRPGNGRDAGGGR